MTDRAIVVTPSDGFAVVEKHSSTTAIVGRILKFTDGQFIVDKTEKLPADTTLVAVGVVTAWVHWVDNKPVEHLVTQDGQYHPEREELADLDQDQWPFGLSGERADPWRDTRYLHLIDPQSGADYTFVTDSWGGRRAVGDLKSSIVNVRSAHPGAKPVILLESVPMKTRFGPRPRPSFKVVGWKGRADILDEAPD
jgi:hypothetical protein